METQLQFIVTGLSEGMIYALIALGFVLIWKSSGVANLALGQLVLFFSWFTYAMLVQVGLPFYLGIPFVLIFAFILGWLIERVILRPLIAQPILSLITVTLGLAFFIEGLVQFIWPLSQAALPRIFPEEPIRIGTAIVTQEQFWATIIALVLFGALTLYFRKFKMGIAMRAAADDQKAVQACGIPVTKIFSSSWMLACVLAAVSGILMSSIGGIKYGLVETGFKSFSVVILGGLDSFGGAMIAGPIIGLAESWGGGNLESIRWMWQGIGEVIPFIVIIIVMFIKPYGLFGEHRIERI
jgi:branched-chain amino acid transport system permease protein